ncbi:MAG: UvrD-helicase domain-containing protein, partial [Prolixibacteraceae bacterium]|nr:UvrD-helicase domain-containing protein [Prolixibacteraceae bacterium]
GKTFQLVFEYILLLMENPYNYKHILAVTFTNKATNEMKSRILEQLHLLASYKTSQYLPVIQKKLALSEEIIRKKARLVLKNILHDYKRFSINTIDTFTQRVIKAFNREMGISPYFTLELDSSLVLDEAVDSLLSKIDNDKKLLKWLVKFSEEKIKDNQSQRIEEDIKSLGKELFVEKFQVFFPEKNDSSYTRKNLNEFKKELDQTISKFEAVIKKKGIKGVEIMSANSLEVDDFSGKSRGMGAFFVKRSNGDPLIINKTIETASEEIEKWYTKTNIKKEHIHDVVKNYLQALLQDILNFYQNNSSEYFTAIVVKKQLRMLGILTDLKEEIKTLHHEKGVLQISDSNLLLSKIIGDSESPFIYEKIGNYYKYFMLDEFQDTSSLQWKNFKPLITNSLSEGNKNLLVGDVKQSIYRWRNSDWDILANQINSDFPNFTPDEISLKYNWRSDKNIIDFNNQVVDELKKSFENFLFEEISTDESSEYKLKFSAIYKNFRQEPGNPKSKNPGFSGINFLPKIEFVENSTKLLIEQVKQLQNNGLKASEIAILIRKNKEGTIIINEFLAAAKLKENSGFNLSVLSNESLFLHASKGVLFVTNIIDLLIDPENKITKAALLNFWFTWLKPELGKLGIQTDMTNNYQSENSSTNSDTDNWQLNENFETIFDDELNQLIANVKEKILLSSLDETLTQICDSFNLFKIETELPFLQTLIDQAGQLKTSFSNDLSNFLFWWNEKGFKTSVNVNEEVDSIRLLTIHKSKGLEFKAVLIPFLNWNSSWTGNMAPTLWCKPETAPFNRFPLLPVKAGSNLVNTLFQKEYFEEKANSFIDTMNLVYVAFTRAKSVLIVNCENPEKPKNSKKTGPGKSINELLKYSLEQSSLQEQFNNCWNHDHTIFQFGEMPFFVSEENISNSVQIKNYQFSDFSDRIKLRLNSEDFLTQGEKNRSVKNIGKLVHEILSGIETINDVEWACKKAFSEGKINKTELENIQYSLTENLKNPKIQPWFNGSYQVLNERSLLSNDKVLRPDRIMISGEKAIVVDYKLGEKKSENYKRQVTRYSKKILETGFKKVDGYLWYINKNEVEKVCEY